MARNDVRLMQYEKAPYEGVLITIPDYKEDALNKVLMEDCQFKMDKISQKDRECLECEYTFLDEVKGFFIGALVGGAVATFIVVSNK